MSIISSEILRCIHENNLPNVTILSDQELEQIYCDITAKFSNANLSYHALWDRLVNTVAHYNPEGWEVIAKLIGENECILFLESEKKFGIKIPSGAILDLILRDTFGYVFYITDVNTDYLFCFNDHDIVLGCGDAAVWLTNYY